MVKVISHYNPYSSVVLAIAQGYHHRDFTATLPGVYINKIVGFIINRYTYSIEYNQVKHTKLFKSPICMKLGKIHYIYFYLQKKLKSYNTIFQIFTL